MRLSDTTMENEPKPNQKQVEAHATAAGEKDTYDLKQRAEKEAIPDEDVQKHWNTRATREDVQSVMSARHTLEENREATRELVRDIFEFLEGLVEDKNVFELGVGIGRMTNELAKRAKEVTGIDLSPVMLEKAKRNLGELDNVKLMLGKVTDLELPSKAFDLVFESIVLLHILNPEELKATIDKLQKLSDRIFIVEHTYEGPDFSISKYSILREPKEYEALFAPYKLSKQKDVKCAGDRFTMMLFENPVAQQSEK